jgi:hypothetical protein
MLGRASQPALTLSAANMSNLRTKRDENKASGRWQVLL